MVIQALVFQDIQVSQECRVILVNQVDLVHQDILEVLVIREIQERLAILVDLALVGYQAILVCLDILE